MPPDLLAFEVLPLPDQLALLTDLLALVRQGDDPATKEQITRLAGLLRQLNRGQSWNYTWLHDTFQVDGLRQLTRRQAAQAELALRALLPPAPPVEREWSGLAAVGPGGAGA